MWIDDVSLKERPNVGVPPGVPEWSGAAQRHHAASDGRYRGRLRSPHRRAAPKYQYILDDGNNAGFQTTGAWQEIDLGTAEWYAIPPYYHAWNNRCHQATDIAGQATWDLALRGPGEYTIQAWWAAAPDAKTWTKQAIYEIVAAGRVLATVMMDETQTGDQWHTLASGLKLDPQDKPYVRVKNGGTGILIADALHVFSAERYNDGQPVRQVSLEPMDGIILRRLATSGP